MREDRMKAFIASIIALIVIAGAAYYVLDSRNVGSDSAYTSGAARPK
jgi:hypothetical protein